MSTQISDEMLMAFVDGELDPATAETVEHAIARDARLSRRADAFRASRLSAREAFSELEREAVPVHLIEAAMRSPMSSSRRGQLRTMAPLAAAVALIAGIGGYLLGQAGTSDRLDLLGGPTLAGAVGATLSGEERSVLLAGREVTIRGLATYPVEGGVCRTFEAASHGAESLRGVGCRFGETWHVDVAVAVPEQEGFAPAGVGPIEAVDAYLEALGAGPPMSQSEEQETPRH